jgi:dTDP-4-dehydrorhamnose reductase
MNVLVTGARGQLGHDVVSALRKTGTEPVAPTRAELDFMRPDSIARCIAAHRPDWIINCAAWTQVDRAESEPAGAFAVNRDAAGQLAGAAAQAGARLLHMSTDFVFDGRQSRPYTESDEPAPLSVYGRSKLEGEQAVAAALPGAIILRTAWVYGVHGHNFVKTMLRLAAGGKPLRVVDDQVGSPTWTADIAAVILRLIGADACGLFHYCNAGRTSWHGFASAILHEAAALGFNIQTRSVEPIPTAAYPTPAVRPAFSVLDTGKIARLLARPVPGWRDSLVAMLKELKTCADCL